MKERRLQMHNEFWLRLDNAAKIYPAIRTRELTAVFRLSVVLKDKINEKQLLQAVHALENRFPYYKVKLKAGFFWFYLQYYNLPLSVVPDTGKYCRSFDKKELMFRVLAGDHSISVEFSHILTDASGAFEFLKSLLLVYFECVGMPLPPGLSYLRPGEIPEEEEYEDAYNRYFRKTVSPGITFRTAFRLPFSVKQPPHLCITTMEIAVEIISGRAKKYGVSLTEYLVAVYLFALQQIYEALPPLKKRTIHKICRIEVPINLRRIYPTRSMRNFSLYVMPEIDFRLGHYDFEEIIKTVYHLMRLETDKKLVAKMLFRNVGGERSAIVKSIPLFIKSFLFARFYSFGTSRYSGVVTNLGKIALPPELTGLIDHFVFVPPPPSRTLKVNCGVIGFGNKLLLSFSNITASDKVEELFLNILEKEGIPVAVRQYGDVQREMAPSSGRKREKVWKKTFNLDFISFFKRIFHT
jgi:hypothetical protein